MLNVNSHVVQNRFPPHFLSKLLENRVIVNELFISEFLTQSFYLMNVHVVRRVFVANLSETLRGACLVG